MSGIALQHGEPVAANDYPSHPLAHGSEVEQGIKSMVSVPINTGGQNPLAIVNVVSRQPNHFTSARMWLLTAVGDGLGGLLDHAKLSQDLESSLVEMAGVDEVARIITSTLNIEEAYNQFTSEMRKLVNFDQGYINLVDQETCTHSVKVLYGVDRPAAGTEVLSVPVGGQLQEVMDSRETLVRSDIEPGPDDWPPGHRPQEKPQGNKKAPDLIQVPSLR